MKNLMKSKTGASLSINIIVVTIIVLIVLVIMVLIFGKSIGSFVTNSKDCESLGGKCEAALPITHPDYPCGSGRGFPIAGTNCEKGQVCCPR